MNVINEINLFLTIVFICEMVIKLWGFGPFLYFMDPMNIFDFIIVMFSIIELIMGALAKNDGNVNLTVFRAFRLFRLLKLVRTFGNLQEILVALGKTVMQTGSFVFLFSLFLFI